MPQKSTAGLRAAAERYARAKALRERGDACWASRVYDPIFGGPGGSFREDAETLADAYVGLFKPHCPKCGCDHWPGENTLCER